MYTLFGEFVYKGTLEYAMEDQCLIAIHLGLWFSIAKKFLNNTNKGDYKNELELLSKNGNYTFEIIRKQGDKLIGIISLNNIDHINQTAELGIMIGEFDEHNKGYGTDAINALLAYAYNTLNLYNIALWVKTFNKSAIACYKKCGFKEVGKRHHCEYCNGKRYDGILMEILKPDWVKKNK